MLNIYLGRESINKEKFMYEKIRDDGGRTIVLVPDQYKLEAERQAFKYMQTDVLLDVEITSMSRLGSNLVKRYGRKDITRIDEYGRHMMLTKIFLEHENEFKLFNMSGANLLSAFLQLVNNFISEAKLANVTAEDFDEMIADEELPDVLRDKLSDIQLIFSKYEEAIEGRFVDSEDYISLYTGYISEDEKIKASNIWVYGFDSFTPKNVDVISALCINAENVNIVLTDSKSCRDEELFALGRMVTGNLCAAARKAGCSHEIHWIGDEYEISEKPQAMKTLERELFAVSRESCENHEGITLVKGGNVYSEVESAASFVLELLSEKKMRYRDIAIICNDQSERLSIIRRTFDEYGMRLFEDSKRPIINSPIAIYLLSILNAIEGGFRSKDVLAAAKTGLSELTEDEVEDLELYVSKYRIKGTAWKKPFSYGEFEYGEDGIAELELLRQKLMKSFEPIENIHKSAGTMREFVVGCYNVLVDSDFIAHIENTVIAQRMAGLNDIAEETEQIWAMIVGAFEQIAELMGEQEADLKVFIEIFTAGLSNMSVGVIPPTADEIILGTMQRTRVPEVKALLVLGANEGLLPMQEEEDLLFSPEEAAFIQERMHFGDKNGVMSMEERIAIYRNLSKPLENLWISYASLSADGKEQRASEIVHILKRIFPRLEECSDVVSMGKAQHLVGGKINTLRHMTQMLNAAKSGARIKGDWKVVKDWIVENYENEMERVIRGLYFDFKEAPISSEMAKKLYKRSETADGFVVSPSRLEKFSRCPFSHYISYGLRPREERVYEAGGREIGDMHHSVIAEFTEYLTENSLWQSITKNETMEKVDEIMRKHASEYREALFKYTSVDSYKLRRAISVSGESCWALVEHYRAGVIKESYFEKAFGRGCDIKPIVVETKGGKVYIEGKIDRLDILPDDSVKIIDYKTGSETFNAGEVASGYRLQLMLYLKAAEEENRTPAGAFYFHIGDPSINVKSLESNKIFEEISKELRKFFKLNGIIIDGADTVRNIAGEFEKESDVMKISAVSGGGYKGDSSNYVMSPEEFTEFEQAFTETVEELCSELVSGVIAIAPKAGVDSNPCTYCQYKSICRYDLHKSLEISE